MPEKLCRWAVRETGQEFPAIENFSLEYLEATWASVCKAKSVVARF
jgi:hypothetical protein